MRKLSVLAGALAALVLCGGAYAQHSGGGGGGGHGGGGGGHGGGGHAVAGGGYHGGGYGGYRGGYGGYRGGYYGGYRGGYYGGYRGGYYGWHGGYYGWRGGYGWGGWGWGWGWPLAAGIYVATLPYYYTTIWYGGIPYYYADDTYYTWDPNANQYVTVAPPAGAVAQAPAGSAGGGGPPPGSDLIAYPKSGQSQEQQAKDKFECHQWAAAQSGFDPTLGSSNVAASRQSDYMRAQAACLEGRGYSVR